MPSLRRRVESIDILRGIVMVIMAIDHARDFFYLAPNTTTDLVSDPTNMSTTTPILFFTRWITHFCAPTFLFLSGISAFLMGQKRSRSDLRIFLMKRGLWLISLEIVVMTFAWTFSPSFNLIILGVIWAIGISMVILGLIVGLSANTIMAIGAVILLGHNLLDIPTLATALQGNLFSDLVFDGAFSFYATTASKGVLIVYAFLPWMAMMFLGYGFGQLFQTHIDQARRKKLLLQSGMGITALFILLRLSNIYGDPSPWSVQPRGPLYTFFSFLNTTKYPASLLYLSMTIGPALIALAVLENYRNRITEFFRQFGLVPMFFYIAHLYLLHAMLAVYFFVSGHTVREISSPESPFNFQPPGFGLGLAGTYIAWFVTIVILYPLCKKYAGYKRTHQQWWLSYL